MRMILKFIFTKLLGWKVTGADHLKVKKTVVIVVPHTSWHDFYVGAFSRNLIQIDIHFVGKKELFSSPFGWYFKWMGGSPIDRSKSQNTVDQIVDLFNAKDEFRLAIAPEGTRKKVSTWKTGFYYIAQKANVPVVAVSFDYSKKEVKINPPFFTTNSIEEDLQLLKDKFEGVVAKVPENAST